MSGHASDESLVELALGTGAAGEREHVASCPSCARRVAEALEALELARRADVPEPSPLYWQALRRGVSRRIDEDARQRRRFAILVPLAAAAALVALLLSGGLPGRKRPAPPGLAAWSALPAEDEDAGLEVLEGLALANGDFADWDAEGLGAYVARLSEDESKLVAEGLRGETGGGES